MRTTLAIDDDILAAARLLAELDRKIVGEVISTLSRQGLAQGPRAARTERNGVLLPCRSGTAPVTQELINQLRDELP
jgi:hypothetical protein